MAYIQESGGTITQGSGIVDTTGTGQPKINLSETSTELDSDTIRQISQAYENIQGMGTSTGPEAGEPTSNTDDDGRRGAGNDGGTQRVIVQLPDEQSRQSLSETSPWEPGMSREEYLALLSRNDPYDGGPRPEPPFAGRENPPDAPSDGGGGGSLSTTETAVVAGGGLVGILGLAYIGGFL